MSTLTNALSPMQGSRRTATASGTKWPDNKISGYNISQIPTMSPEQLNVFQNMLSQLGPEAGQAIGRLSAMAGGEASAFEPYERFAQSQFQKSLGDIGSRFSGMGLGGRHGSAFQNAVAGAGSELAEKLASQRLGYQQQAQGQLLDLVRALLGSQTHETFLQPEKQPFWKQLFGGLSAPVGAGLGALVGIPAGNPLLGAQIGGQLGSAIGSGISGQPYQGGMLTGLGMGDK